VQSAGPLVVAVGGVAKNWVRAGGAAMHEYYVLKSFIWSVYLLSSRCNWG